MSSEARNPGNGARFRFRICPLHFPHLPTEYRLSGLVIVPRGDALYNLPNARLMPLSLMGKKVILAKVTEAMLPGRHHEVPSEGMLTVDRTNHRPAFISASFWTTTWVPADGEGHGHWTANQLRPVL